MFDNIWSQKKSVNTIVNILLLLMAMNFLHYGQFILPIICLILFIDNKFKFKINNLKIFIILCLFAITFFLFSFKFGYYSVMGFCLPMAYYVGSNTSDKSTESIKKIIYILAFGMAIHVVLNFVYEAFYDGPIKLFFDGRHRDIWLQDKIAPTITAVNYTFIIGIIGYLIFTEKNKILKTIGILLFSAIFVYNLGLGRRTPLLMVAISLLVYLFLNAIAFNKNKKYLKTFFIVFIIIVLVILVFYIIYKFDIFNLKNLLIFTKFRIVGLKAERIEIFIEALKMAPSHLRGGKELSTIMGVEVHDLWMDIYDFGGLAPFILMFVYTIITIICAFKLFANQRVDAGFRTMYFTLSMCILMQMLLEPIMSGSSLFLICSVLVFTLVEGIKIEKY